MKKNRSNGSNAEPMHEAQQQQLKEIKRLVADADTKLLGYRKSLYGALGKLFDLTRSLQDGGELESFVRTNGLDFGRVAQKNPFQPLVSLAFSRSAEATAISKYATLLQYAEKEKPAGSSMADWIDASGGIEEIVARARQSTQSIVDQLFEETTEEHLERANNVLAKQRLGSIEAPADLQTPVATTGVGFQRALVRRVDGKIEIVGLVDASATELQQDVFRLVPAEAPLSRRKLKDKPHYTLFRAADTALRFMKPVKDEVGTAKKSIKDRYLPDAGLEITKGPDGLWLARTISTQPSAIIIEAKLTNAFDAFGNGQLFFSYGGMKRLAGQFSSVSTWTPRLRQPAGPDGNDVASDGEVLLDPLDVGKAWRRLSKRMKRVATFALGQSRLLELSRWPSTYQDAARAAGAGGFPKLLQVSINGTDIGLSVPGHTQLAPADRARLTTLQQNLYDQQFRSLGQLNQPPAKPLEQTWLRRSDLLSLATLSVDYGVSFEAELCAVGDGLCLRLHDQSNAIQLTVPLAVSLAGDYATILV